MNDNNEHVTLQELMASKLSNARGRFANEICEAGLQKEVEELTVDALVAQLISMRPMWDVVESRDTAFFLALISGTCEPEDDGRVQQVIHVVENLSTPKEKLLWDYICWFLKCIKSTL